MKFEFEFEFEIVGWMRPGFEESHQVFRNAMPTGFAWEVTEVYSGYRT